MAVTEVGSRDLSERCNGYLEIMIQGISGLNVSSTKFVNPEPLSTHVRVAYFMLKSKWVEVEDPRCSPWKLVEYDKARKRLVVRTIT